VRSRLYFQGFGPRALLALALAAFAAPCAAQTVVAEVGRLVGTATAQLPGAERRTLALGAPVYLLDRIETAPRAVLRLEFRDKTSLALGEQASMTITHYGAEPSEPSFLAEIARGTFRVVTGLIARTKPAAFRVTTPSSSIGIRGTHFAGETDGARSVVILLEPQRGEPGRAIEVSNPFGSVTIEQPGFGTEIPDAQSPPSPPRRMRLRSIENLIRSTSTIQRAVPRAPR